MRDDEDNIPEQYRELLKKIEAIEKVLGLSAVEKIVEETWIVVHKDTGINPSFE